MMGNYTNRIESSNLNVDLFEKYWHSKNKKSIEVDNHEI